jgi:hypothetical protein
MNVKKETVIGNQKAKNSLYPFRGAGKISWEFKA